MTKKEKRKLLGGIIMAIAVFCIVGWTETCYLDLMQLSTYIFRSSISGLVAWFGYAIYNK